MRPSSQVPQPVSHCNARAPARFHRGSPPAGAAVRSPRATDRSRPSAWWCAPGWILALGLGWSGLTQAGAAEPRAAEPAKADTADRSAVLPTQLRWQKRDAAGWSTGLVPELQPREGKRVIGHKIKRAPDGAITERHEMRALDPKIFHGSDTFFAELDPSVRAAPAYLHFMLSGVMRARPEEGTILNIDGAVLGFREQPPRVAGEAPKLAELVTYDVDAAGAFVWRPTGVFFTLHADRPLSAAPKLCVRLDHAAQSWTLLARDIVVAGDLALFSVEERPVVSIRAGLPGDEAWLKDLKVRRAPPRRPPHFLPAENGRLDLARAYAEGDERVIRGVTAGPPAAARTGPPANAQPARRQPEGSR